MLENPQFPLGKWDQYPIEAVQFSHFARGRNSSRFMVAEQKELSMRRKVGRVAPRPPSLVLANVNTRRARSARRTSRRLWKFAASPEITFGKQYRGTGERPLTGGKSGFRCSSLMPVNLSRPLRVVPVTMITAHKRTASRRAPPEGCSNRNARHQAWVGDPPALAIHWLQAALWASEHVKQIAPSVVLDCSDLY
jgi:hypothetical protein